MIVAFLIASVIHLATANIGLGCGAAERQSIRDLLNQDIFLRHLNTGMVNASLNKCSNFHRHICPKGGLSDRASTKGLFEEILSIEKSCTQYDIYSKIEGDFNDADQFDKFPYTNQNSLSSVLFPMSDSVLLFVYEFTALHIQKPAEFYRNVWNKQAWSPAIDQAMFPDKYDPETFANNIKRKAFVNKLANHLVNITNSNGGIAGMKSRFLPFYKDVTDYNLAVHILHREGLEVGSPRERLTSTLIKVAEEYGRKLQETRSSVKESKGKSRFDRFYDSLMDVYHTTLNSSLNNIGTQGASRTLPRDFYNFYTEERGKLSEMIGLPYLRNFLAVWKAQERSLTTYDLSLPYRWKIIPGPIPNTINSYFVWIFVRNQAIFELITQSSPPAAVFGSIGYTYAHEIYHGVQWMYKELMPKSNLVSASSTCANNYFSLVGAQFPEDSRFQGWPVEEEADLYGSQIAYGAFVNEVGSAIDDIVYPSLNLTQLNVSSSSDAININPPFIYIPDAHYEVNGRLAQINDFKSTFQCAETDKMIFPKKVRCPVFSGSPNA